MQRSRVEGVVLYLVLIGAWVLRASPFFRPTGVLGWPLDYDEGTYLSAAHSLWQGVLPWRDFVFLHPPGILYLFSPLALLEPRQAYGAARWAMTLVGTANVALIFALLRRRAAFAPALLGAVLYAAWPEAVASERAALIEPLLNLCCLTLLLLVERSAPDLAIGALMGVALGIKVWAIFWVFTVVVLEPRRALRRLGWAALVAAALVSPAFFSPIEALHQLVLTHARRPFDGDLSTWVRLREMFYARNCLPVVLVLASLTWLLQPSRWAQSLLFLLPTGLVSLAFLAAPAFWNQYDTHLAAPLSLLAAWSAVPWLERVPKLLAIPLALLIGVPGTWYVIERRHEVSADPGAVMRAASSLPADARICSMAAFEVLVAGRWPAPPHDPYGTQLAEATRTGPNRDLGAALSDPGAQRRLRREFQGCDAYLETDRDQELTPETRAALSDLFPIAGSAGFRSKGR